MNSPHVAPPEGLHGVATPDPDLPVDSRPCAKCGRPIPRPRKKQKACSPACRWALWKAGRQGQEQARRERDHRLVALAKEIVTILEER
jgi:hypothetical protein